MVGMGVEGGRGVGLERMKLELVSSIFTSSMAVRGGPPSPADATSWPTSIRKKEGEQGGRGVHDLGESQVPGPGRLPRHP